MHYFYIYFIILAAQISIFSIECVEINSFVNNNQEEINSTTSKIFESNGYKHNKFHSLIEKYLLNMSNLEERSNISKSQFNRTRSISVQPQNIRITFLLSKFMRMKRELHKKRLNNNSVNRIKNVQHSTNINYRVDSGTGETPNLPANQETTEANSGTANGENTLNNGENSKTDESNKNEENGTTTETPVDPEEEGEVSLEEIEQDQARLDFLIGKVKKLLTDSGDYIMSVLLRILKEHLRKYSFGSRFMEKVKEMAKKYQGNVLVAKQELEKRLGRKFGKKFRMMLIKLLRTLVVGGTLPK